MDKILKKGYQGKQESKEMLHNDYKQVQFINIYNKS